MTTRERLSLDGLPLNSGSFQEYLSALSPSIWLPLGSSNGLTDLSGNGYNGTANGGLTVGGGTGLLTGVSDTSTDFDGSNDYISTTYTTRRNLCTDPRATSVAGAWVNNSLTAFEAVTTLLSYSGLPADLTTAHRAVGDASGDSIRHPFSVTSGLTYRCSIYVRLTTLTATGLQVRIRNAALATKAQGAVFATVAGAAGAFTRLDLSVVADATETWTVEIRQDGAGAAEWHSTAWLIELSTALGTYFDGTGYVNDSGTWVADPGGHVGWLGTAHASASDKGAFANGTVRGMGAPLRVDSLAAVRGLIGSATNGLWVDTDGSLNLRIAGTDVTGNAGDLTAASTAFPWAEFDEPNNTVRFYVNGVLVDTVTGVTAQWAAETLNVGRARGIYQDGLMQHVAVVEGALTAAQIQALYEVGAEGQYTIQGLNIGPPSKRLLWQARKDGDALGDVPGYERRTVTAKIRVPGATDKDEALDRLGRLVEKLQYAEQVEGGIDAVWQPAGGTFTGTLKVLAGEITELPIEMTGDNAGWFIEHPVAEIRLDCKPFLYGTEVTTSAVTNTNPHQELTITDVPGDVPAEGRLIVTDAATQERDHVEWGLQVASSAEIAKTLLIDSASLTTSGYAGSANTRTGAYSASGVIRGTAVTSWTVLTGTGNLTHVGSFRVKARCYATADGVSARLAYRVRDGAYTQNSTVEIPLANQWVEIDLGTVYISEAVTGTHRWDGRIEFKSTTSGTTFDVDYIDLIPAERYGLARAPSPLPQANVAVYSVWDDFQQTAGALVGKAPQLPTATTYTGVGDADDFTVATGTGYYQAGYATRSTVSDTAPRIDTLDVNLTATFGSVYVRYDTTAVVPQLGFVVRFVDVSNYLAFRLLPNNGGSNVAHLVLIKRVAGTDTALYTGVVGTAAQGWYGMGLSASTAGEWIAHFAEGGVWRQMGVGTDSVLATAGALATGDVGMYDYNSTATVTERRYDLLNAYTVPNAAAIFSGQSIEFRSDVTIREDSGGTVWGRPPVARGSRFYIPHSGDEDKQARIVAKARRRDIATLPDDQIADSTTVQVAYVPRYLVVPRS